MLELYCGNGNHTVALASSFASVAAVELSAALCDAARANLARNGVSNARVFRAPSEAVARRALRRRRARGAAEATGKNNGTRQNDDADDPGDATVASLDVDAFDCVLVDPPRAGLDPDTLALVKKFDVVLYVSCDPNSLLANATAKDGLAESHALRRFAVFDHFPYTRHVEVGVYANAFEQRFEQGYAANGVILDHRAELNDGGYSAFAARWVDAGATIIGGCCGIMPHHIADIASLR